MELWREYSLLPPATHNRVAIIRFARETEKNSQFYNCESFAVVRDSTHTWWRWVTRPHIPEF